jgi:catechol 2,3-dioxygenase-like lactoylglutathione lyase family enzyme
MRIEYLDHVALWVADRDVLADFLTRHVGMHVIERTDSFTIVGAHARRGKLTLFAAEGEREPGQLARVALRVRDLSEALDKLPTDLAVTRPTPELAVFTAPEDLGLGLIEAAGEDYDLDHVVVKVSDPDEAFHSLSTLGFATEDGRLRAGAPGSAYLELQQGDQVDTERPLLNHLGLRVESAAEHIEEAEKRGLEIADVVDAPNTYALFVWGPDRLKLEYVEHKESFSLA